MIRYSRDENRQDLDDSGVIHNQIEEYHVRAQPRSPSSSSSGFDDSQIAALVQYEDRRRRPNKRSFERGRYESIESNKATNFRQTDDDCADEADEAEEERYDGTDDDDGSASIQSQQEVRHFSSESLEESAGSVSSMSAAASAVVTAAAAKKRSAVAVAKELEALEWVYVKPEEEHFPEDPAFNQDGSPADPNYCFMCDCSQNAQEMISNPEYNRCKTIFDHNYGICSPQKSARLVQEVYDMSLRPHTDAKAHWSCFMIHQHFTVHAPSTAVMQEDALRVMNCMMATIKKEELFQEHVHTKRRKIDPKGLTMYMKIYDKRKGLITQVTSKRSNNIA